MPDSSTFAIFLGASLALLLAPGPAVLFVITKSVERGRTAGVVLGLSALLVSSAAAYTTLKYLGAAYLFYLGVRRLVSRSAHSLEEEEGSGFRSLFSQGLVVNVLNPKVALFFLAFLPQFAEPGRGSMTLQLGALGLSFVLLGIATDIGYGLLAGTVRTWLTRSRVFLRSQKYVTGVIYIGLGLAAAVAGTGRRQ